MAGSLKEGQGEVILFDHLYKQSLYPAEDVLVCRVSFAMARALTKS